jgi:two-component system, OmpR family, phosphate regulon sensor histidine kinase PhoR
VRKRKLFWQFFGAHIVILLIAVGAVSLYTWSGSRRAFKAQWISELEVQAELAVAMLGGEGRRLDSPDECRDVFNRLARLDRHRFTLILPDGTVIGDSRAPHDSMDSHGMRPEVLEARGSGGGRSERYSMTLNRQMLYVARRIPADLDLPEQAIVRVAVPYTTLARELSSVDHGMIVVVSGVLLATLLLSYLAALRIVGPVADLQSGLTRIGNGDYAFRLSVPPVPHLAELVRSINQTADQLENRIHQIEEERNLRMLILKGMDLGLIAVDSGMRIMNMNKSALNLLNVHAEKITGSKIGEIIRYPALLKFLEISRVSDQKTESTLQIEIDGESGAERTLTLQANALNDLQNQRIGTLLVLSDITRIRRLETVRQDFVDNVSHELRTPITSIKGFSETLLDGALDDPDTARRFVEIIARQADQLEQIIRDLLELSRLDRSSDKELDCSVTPVAGMLKNAAELCQNRADATGVQMTVNCPRDAFVNVHSGLIEQALVNLIDNALKYGCTENSKKIEIFAVKNGLTVSIKVRDFGAGVEKRHRERMFERFYRIDSGRSRDLGGTGLGLSIVRHIVLLHQGTVDVESEPGQGACFTITLPTAEQPER